MNNKLNGWNNNLTPFDGVGGKPGYHEKIQTMTPEQKKAKEIFEKYRKITYIDEYGNENYERLSLGAAKTCAIEEVKAVYLSLREQLFNLRSSYVIESETVYLKRLDKLIVGENQLKEEIEKL